MGKATRKTTGKAGKPANPGKLAKAADNAQASQDDTARRAKRAERIDKAMNVSFTLELPVRRFMDSRAKAAGMNLNHYLQMVVENHVIEVAPKDDALALRLAAKRAVIDRTVTLANDMYEAGRFDDHFIVNVVREAATDDAFSTEYAKAIGGDDAKGTRASERSRISLNQQIGRVIKKAVGARSKRTEAGKIARGQAQDALITSYTLLEKAA
jgi:hypothetical protein